MSIKIDDDDYNDDEKVVKRKKQENMTQNNAYCYQKSTLQGPWQLQQRR